MVKVRVRKVGVSGGRGPRQEELEVSLGCLPARKLQSESLSENPKTGIK